MKLFIPNLYISNFDKLKVENLLNQGIKVLIIDVDNTLVCHHSTEVEENAIEFIQKVKEEGIYPVLISNNKKERISIVANKLEIDFFWFACKPLKRKYKEVLRKYNCSPSEVAALGDQLVTDICGANRMKFFSILQDPLEDKENAAGKITRAIEKKIFAYFDKKGKLRKGEYDEQM